MTTVCIRCGRPAAAHAGEVAGDGSFPAADPWPLADRVRQARHPGICTMCKAPITIGQPIAHLAKPPGWCHVRCAPAVAAITTTDRTAP